MKPGLRGPAVRALVLAALLAPALGAHAAEPAASASRPAGAVPARCPAPADLDAADLHGLWRAEIDGRHAGTLLLEANPNWAGSLAGQVNRDGARAWLAGDLDEGELVLEESADRQRISATWVGRVVPGSCGREVRGTWQAEGGGMGQAFRLVRLAP